MKEVTLKQGVHKDSQSTVYFIFENEVLKGETLASQLRDTIEHYLERDYKVIVKK